MIPITRQENPFFREFGGEVGRMRGRTLKSRCFSKWNIQQMTQPANDEPSDSRGTSVAESLLILAATAMISAAVLHAEPLQSANDRSRWATVWSLVERGTYQIDEIDQIGRWSTIDKVRFRASESEPWHFYSSKPPLLSTLVAGLYSVERWTLAYGLFNHTALVTRLLLLFVNVLPFFLALRSLTRCGMLLGASTGARVFVLAVAGFGSILNPYLTTLNNHTPAVACAMFAITAAVRILFSARECERSDETARSRPIDFASLGFFAALTCCFELPAAQMGVLAFALAICMNRRWAISWFIPAAAIPLVAFFATNWLATGGIQPFYAGYGGETYVYEHNGIPSYWSNPQDLDANQESPPMYLFHCVLGHHGLLSLTPVLCLSVFGWWVSVMNRENPCRRMLILAGAVMTATTLGFYLTRTQNYNYGGNSVGLRWMLWLSPFWWIAMLPALETFHRRRFHVIAGMLLLISMVSVGWSINRPWRPSWLFEQMEAAGWIHYRTSPKPFDPPRYSVLNNIPETVGTTMTWESSDHDRLTLSVDSASADAGDHIVLGIELNGLKTSATLDRKKLLAGRPMAEYFQCDHATNVLALRKLPEILQGLPFPRHYNSAGPTWISSKADPTKAWKVERAAARVSADDPVFGRCWHRCDVLYCDQLPFGVLQWKMTITSDATGETLSTTTWIAEEH